MIENNYIFYSELQDRYIFFYDKGKYYKAAIHTSKQSAIGNFFVVFFLLRKSIPSSHNNTVYAVALQCGVADSEEATTITPPNHQYHLSTSIYRQAAEKKLKLLKQITIVQK